MVLMCFFIQELCLDNRLVNKRASSEGSIELKSRLGQICHRLQTIHYRFNIHTNSWVALALCCGDEPR